MSRAVVQVALVGSSAAEPRMRCSMPFVTVEFPHGRRASVLPSLASSTPAGHRGGGTGDCTSADVAVPADLAAALGQDAEAQTFFDQLAFTHRKEWVHWVEAAKKVETRAARITKAVASLHASIRMH